MKRKRRGIVVDEVKYQWSAVMDEYSCRLRVEIAALAPPPPEARSDGKRIKGATQRSSARTSVLHVELGSGTLVLPSVIRHLILEARGLGWLPIAPNAVPFHLEPRGPFPDEADAKHTPEAHGSDRTERGLLAAIREAPNDDAPRLVYADWLLENGDARGEYISLACAAALSPLPPVQAERMWELFEALQDRWLGPLAEVTSARRWHRGLLDQVQLRRRKRGVVAPAVGHPAWQTLRRLDACGSYLVADDVRTIVGHPVLAGLEGLKLSVPAFVALAADQTVPDATELHVEAVILSDKTLLAALVPYLRTRVSGSPRPLRRLRVMLAGPSIPLLERCPPTLVLEVASALTDLESWRDALETSRAQLQALHVNRGFVGLFEQSHIEAIFRRDARQEYGDLEIRWTTTNDFYGRQALLEGVTSLASGALSVVRATGPVDVHWDLRAWLQDLGDVLDRQQRDARREGGLVV